MKNLTKEQKKHLNRSYHQFELIESLITGFEENLFDIDDELEDLVFNLRDHFYKTNSRLRKAFEEF